MKRFLLLFSTILVGLIAFSQTNPCVRSYSRGNSGGGNCPTTGNGNNKYYPGHLSLPADSKYFPTGKITVNFLSPIPAGVDAPLILAAGPDNGSGQIVDGQNFDYKYRAFNDDKTTTRTSVTYCYYGSASNQNIFNGNNAPLLAFVISYSTDASSQSCGGVVEVPDNTTLPVSFKTFIAERKSTSSVSLKWTTSSEQNNKGFYVQRNSGSGWKDAGFVFSQANDGNSSVDLSYEFKDVNAEKGITQYRILQVDIDGKGRYSEIRAVRGEGAASKVVVYPNPSSNGNINVVFEDNSVRDILISDLQGKIVKQYREVTGNVLQVEGLVTGFYTMKVVNRSTAISVVEKVVVK